MKLGEVNVVSRFTSSAGTEVVRRLRASARVCRLGTTADFACIADEALLRDAPVAIDLPTARRFVVYAWAKELAAGSLWRRALAWIVTRAFFRLARGRV